MELTLWKSVAAPRLHAPAGRIRRDCARDDRRHLRTRRLRRRASDQEIGIRLAVGATSGQILALILGRHAPDTDWRGYGTRGIARPEQNDVRLSHGMTATDTSVPGGTAAVRGCRVPVDLHPCAPYGGITRPWHSGMVTVPRASVISDGRAQAPPARSGGRRRQLSSIARVARRSAEAANPLLQIRGPGLEQRRASVPDALSCS